MANALLLNVEILGEFKNLTNATKGASAQLSGLNKTTSAISSGMIKTLGAIGVGFSLGAIVNQFQAVTKAAIEDVKSQKILALAMENTGNATAGQIAQAEKLIGKLQITTAVADDQLRPAFQKMFIATGDVTRSNKLLEIALDASAATGKDLDSVSQAMAKSLAGSDTALVKLIPSLKNAKDPLAELEATFKGAAEAAADTDPYKRIGIIFDEVQEQIGVALLPILEDLSTWFVEILPDIQNFLDLMSKSFEDPAVKKAIGEMQDSLGDLGASIATLFGSTETEQAKGFMNFWIGLAAIIKFLADSFNTLIAPINSAFGNTKGMENWLDQLFGLIPGYTDQLEKMRLGTPLPNTGRSNDPRSSGSVINNNISVRTDATAQEIADAINRANRATGTNLIR
jgi:hypothetical protein